MEEVPDTCLLLFWGSGEFGYTGVDIVGSEFPDIGPFPLLLSMLTFSVALNYRMYESERWYCWRCQMRLFPCNREVLLIGVTIKIVSSWNQYYLEKKKAPYTRLNSRWLVLGGTDREAGRVVRVVQSAAAGVQGFLKPHIMSRAPLAGG